MRKLISLSIAIFMLISSLAACTVNPTASVTASDDAAAKYAAFLEERLDVMPDTLVIGDADTATEHGVDMADFADDGFFTRAVDGEVLIFGKTEDGIDRAVRDFVKYGNSDAYSKTYGEGYRVKRLTIAGNDISEYAVVRDDDADECQTFAATELVSYVEKTCGAILPSYTASEYASASSLKPSRTIRLTVNYPELGDEGFTISLGDDSNITIFGGRYRGCMYGVYGLLDDIGWRFLADPVGRRPSDIDEHPITYSNENGCIDYLYEAERVDLTSAINRTETPSIAFRQLRDEGDTLTSNVGNIALKSKVNVHSGSLSKATAGSYGITPVACHGLQAYHDEIFSGEYKGLYQGLYVDGYQPCLNDEYTLEAIYAFTLRYVETRLAAGQEIGRDFTNVDLSQWDGFEYHFCRCHDCMEVFAEEGSHMGSMLRMGNAAAKLLTDNGYGDLSVTLLAYCGTNKPPKITRPLDNVRISYCVYTYNSLTTCSNHCMSGEDCDDNPKYSNVLFGEELKEWASICKNDNLDVWYYPMNYYCYAFPSPYFDIIWQDYKFMDEVGASGVIMLNKDLDGAHLDSLALYLAAKMAWDCTITKEEYYAYMLEYLQIVYGDAGEEMYDYITSCEDMANKTGCWSAFGSTTSEKINTAIYKANFERFCDLFDRAKALADTSHQEFLVKLYETGMLYCGLGLTHTDHYLNGTEEERAVYVERYRYLHDACIKYGIILYDSDSAEKNAFAPEVLDLEEGPFEWISQEKWRK